MATYYVVHNIPADLDYNSVDNSQILGMRFEAAITSIIIISYTLGWIR